MEEPRVLRRPVLLVSRELEPGATMSDKEKCSIVTATHLPGHQIEKGSHIPLLTIANKSAGITLVQTIPKRGGKSYSEFPIDRNRAVFPGLHLGASFSSYLELTELMHRFQKAKGVHLYIRSSRKLYPAVNNMGGTVREYNLDLMFADIYYSCTKGGRRFCRSSSTASAQQEVRNCPFNIKLRLTRDGQRLYIRDIYPAHNHYLDRNSQPRIPNPSIVENKLRPVEKIPIAVQKPREVRALIGRRLVVLTKTPQKVLPMTASATGEGTELKIQADDGAPRIIAGTLREAVIKRNSDECDVLRRHTDESSIDLEPECILGMEEKIVPDVDDDDQEETHAETSASQTEAIAGFAIPSADIKPCIKEEILDECPVTVPPFAGDIELPCADENFVLSRRQIIDLVKFCPRCGSQVANRYYSDRVEALGVALICAVGHTVELSLGKQSTRKHPARAIGSSVIANCSF